MDLQRLAFFIVQATGAWHSNTVADSLGEQKGRPSVVGTDDDVLDTTVGFRSICVSRDGHHLAAGDSSGNLRIYDLSTLLLHSFQV